MNTFFACVAFGPLAIYLLLLGAVNLAPRPLVITGTRESLALGLALAGLAVVGPMQLFMPQEAAGHFGELVWLLLASFYVLSLTLVILVSRPRLIIYNVSIERFREVLSEAARHVDPDTVEAGGALCMPLARVQLRVENFAPMGNVMLLATGDEQSASGWRRLEQALRAQLHEAPVASKSHGLWLTLAGLAMLAALVFWVADDPQMVVQGFNRMLHP